MFIQVQSDSAKIEDEFNMRGFIGGQLYTDAYCQLVHLSNLIQEAMLSGELPCRGEDIDPYNIQIHLPLKLGQSIEIVVEYSSKTPLHIPSDSDTILVK